VHKILLPTAEVVGLNLEEVERQLCEINSNNLLALFSNRTNEKVQKAKNQGFDDK
jgi:hypothetical protein